MNKHIGSHFDDFLEEEGILAEVEAIAHQRVSDYVLGWSDDELRRKVEEGLAAFAAGWYVECDEAGLATLFEKIKRNGRSKCRIQL
jgi:hypothetical protein